jgi:hypothetical protein
MVRWLRWRRRVEWSQQAHIPPVWQCLVAPGFRLVTFGVIACYVEVLVSDGHGLVGAVVAAVGVAAGAWVSTMSDPFARLSSGRA